MRAAKGDKRLARPTFQNRRLCILRPFDLSNSAYAKRLQRFKASRSKRAQAWLDDADVKILETSAWRLEHGGAPPEPSSATIAFLERGGRDQCISKRVGRIPRGNWTKHERTITTILELFSNGDFPDNVSQLVRPVANSLCSFLGCLQDAEPIDGQQLGLSDACEAWRLEDRLGDVLHFVGVAKEALRKQPGETLGAAGPARMPVFRAGSPELQAFDALKRLQKVLTDFEISPPFKLIPVNELEQASSEVNGRLTVLGHHPVESTAHGHAEELEGNGRAFGEHRTALGEKQVTRQPEPVAPAPPGDQQTGGLGIAVLKSPVESASKATSLIETRSCHTSTEATNHANRSKPATTLENKVDVHQHDLTFATIPKLSEGEWITQEKAAEESKLKIRTLKNKRHNGQRAEDLMSGKDKDGRVWRKQTLNSTKVHYLRSSLPGR